MPGPRAVQNLQMPHPRDWQGGQMSRSSPGGEGGWAQPELTDALRDQLSVNTKTVRFWKILLARADRAY